MSTSASVAAASPKRSREEDDESDSIVPGPRTPDAVTPDAVKAPKVLVPDTDGSEDESDGEGPSFFPMKRKAVIRLWTNVTKKELIIYLRFIARFVFMVRTKTTPPRKFDKKDFQEMNCGIIFWLREVLVNAPETWQSVIQAADEVAAAVDFTKNKDRIYYDNWAMQGRTFVDNPERNTEILPLKNPPTSPEDLAAMTAMFPLTFAAE